MDWAGGEVPRDKDVELASCVACGGGFECTRAERSVMGDLLLCQDRVCIARREGLLQYEHRVVKLAPGKVPRAYRKKRMKGAKTKRSQRADANNDTLMRRELPKLGATTANYVSMDVMEALAGLRERLEEETLRGEGGGA